MNNIKRLQNWRTKTGHEVDFIIGRGETALEVKGVKRVDNRDVKGLKAFMADYHPKKAIVVSNESQARLESGIYFLPWREFLEQLWEGKVI